MDTHAFEVAYIERPVASPALNLSSRLIDGAIPQLRTAEGLTMPHLELPEEESNATGSLNDWAGELNRAADDVVRKEAAEKPRGFGFPQSPAAAAKPRQFGWDPTATHRVESLPGGGIVIHLNDNCVLVLFPLPFAGCAIGKRKPNGDLFEHMNEAPSTEGTETK